MDGEYFGLSPVYKVLVLPHLVLVLLTSLDCIS